jgi:hypothetical protein
MPKLKGDETLEIPSWVGGLEKNTPPALNEPGTLADGQNLVPTQAARLACRGGSRIVTTLHNDGAGAEVTGLAGLFPWTSIGAVVLGYDTIQHKSYAWYMTQDMAFKGATEAQSRVDLSLEPTGTVFHGSWKDTGGSPIPQATELFEGIYLCDATLSVASRRYFLSLNQTVPVVQVGSPNPDVKVPRFAFAGTGDNGTATAGAGTTLTDTTKAWRTNQFAGQTVTIVGGTAAGEFAIVTSNTGTVLTVPSWSTPGTSPDATSQYIVTPGIPREMTPYCLETYNNVLFIAGYGDESAGNVDRPEYLRHSFLGIAPSNSLALGDNSDGFDKNAWNIIGAKGQRITAMKQGRGFLLVAKANELYRVSGAGRAYPGWQYAVEMVMNTSGLGVANPSALCFAEGYWYGIGAAGMFRTDGFTVTPMIGPRKADFLSIDNLASSFCFYHPDRRLVVFGVHPQGTIPASYPWELWTWDTERERWQPDWVFATPTAFFHGNNIATTSVPGPSAPPSAPMSAAPTTTGFTASWTNGDATAQTEVWLLDGVTMTWDLNTTVAAAINTVAVTGCTQHTTCSFKVRHVKNGLYSAYSATLPVQTLIAPPVLQVVVQGASYLLSVGDSVCTMYNSTDGITYSVYQVGFPQYAFTVVPTGFFWKATVTDSTWSVPTSTFSNVVTT